jgi:hypothetical protein
LLLFAYLFSPKHLPPTKRLLLSFSIVIAVLSSLFSSLEPSALNTRSCIRSFQKANGLDATGEVDDTTYEAMLERL